MSGKNILLFSRERKGFRFNNVWVWALMRLEILSYGENIKDTDNLPNNSEVFPRNIKCGYLIFPLPRVIWFLHYSPQNICRLYQNSVLWLHLHPYEQESSLHDIYEPMRHHKQLMHRQHWLDSPWHSDYYSNTQTCDNWWQLKLV